jgi:hypothetical protein
MQDAPVLTQAEREAYIDRCPEGVRKLFRGWLQGTHDLDGTPVEEEAVSRLERSGVGIGHFLGAAILMVAPSLRPQNRPGNDWGPR